MKDITLKLSYAREVYRTVSLPSYIEATEANVEKIVSLCRKTVPSDLSLFSIHIALDDQNDNYIHFEYATFDASELARVLYLIRNNHSAEFKLDNVAEPSIRLHPTFGKLIVTLPSAKDRTLFDYRRIVNDIERLQPLVSLMDTDSLLTFFE